ncbi:MAG: hypothetical protein ABSD21_05570 [Rhizomicrobium sp.]|jgi:hypothetical protein
MRTLLIAVFVLFATAASAEEPSDRALPLRLPPDTHKAAAAAPEKLSPPSHDAFWVQDKFLGDALGHWLGVHNGRWDMFEETLATTDEGGPTIAGTVRKNRAEIQLRWHPDE